MIDISKLPEMFVLGASGAACIEALIAYELRSKLHLVRYRKLRRSFLFWFVTIAFLAVAGIISWVFNENNPNASIAQLFITGMGASSILRKISEAVASSARLSAGEDDDASIKDMFA